ncbi:PAS domain S-box-containing protein [Flexibacter flexilis DSM 6793]|uniref:PAS domain S-box-containing protein n=1 Tax=Flexibacter flexilis DSM 6793 TaxID=927664 RepID=A0A1I1H4J1_9BACT|nr:PAS domain-containing protein [Flexibacter flexilis]SFC18874.1 PAS domain S-box-containing protein [Flexibacter flexilis DSM 6793]
MENSYKGLNQLFEQLYEVSHKIHSELDARMKVLAETSLVSETDKYGNITYVNEQLCRVSGYTQDELLGKPQNLLRHPETPEIVFREMWTTIKSGQVWKGTLRNRTKEGQTYWVQLTIAPVLDENGEPVKYIGVNFDITEQMQQRQIIADLLAEAEEHNQQLLMHQEELVQNIEEIRAIQESLKEKYRESEQIRSELDARVGVLNHAALVSETDAFGTITFVNDHFCKISGYSREELMGQPHSIVRHPETPSAIFRKMWATIKAGGIFQGTIKNQRKDGEPYWVQVTIAPVLDETGEPVRYIGVRFDITEQVLQQEAVQELLRETEAQNAELIRNREELRHKKQITDSINYAKRIQEALLPQSDLIHKRFPKSFILYKAKDIVSGDFYWFHTQPDFTAVAAIDCTGHGVPGAFMSVMANSLISEIIIDRNITSPDLVLDMLLEKVIRTLRQTEPDGQPHDGMDLGLCIIHHQTKTLEFAGANRPLYWIRDGIFNEIKGNAIPIGGWRYAGKKFTKHMIQIQEGDRFYLASDGYQDQFGGPNNRRFSAKRLHQVLASVQETPIHEQGDALSKIIMDWLGRNRQIDDILLLGFEV